MSLITSQQLTTEQVALLSHNNPNSIRSRLCKTGSYYGVKPIKLPSGRLLWPAEQVQALLAGEGA